MLIYLFEQVPGGSLLSVMEFGFLGMDSLTSQNQFLLGLGINSDNQDSLMNMDKIGRGDFDHFFTFPAKKIIKHISRLENAEKNF